MLEENKKKILIVGAICVIIIIGGILYYFLQDIMKEEYIDFESLEDNVENIIQNEVVEVVEEAQIVIHISGEVTNPGVISLKEGARVIDAINNAGGLTSKADISKVNLAYVLEDAQKIYIPSIDDKEDSVYILEGSGDTEIVTSGAGNTENKKEGKLMININTATEEQLQELAGIGDSIAKRIVDYRKENGKFNSIEDIKNVSGIGDAKFNKIKDNICVK